MIHTKALMAAILSCVCV